MCQQPRAERSCWARPAWRIQLLRWAQVNIPGLGTFCGSGSRSWGLRPGSVGSPSPTDPEMLQSVRYVFILLLQAEHESHVVSVSEAKSFWRMLILIVTINCGDRFIYDCERNLMFYGSSNLSPHPDVFTVEQVHQSQIKSSRFISNDFTGFVFFFCYFSIFASTS